MNRTLFSFLLLFVVGCAGSSGDLAIDNGRAEVLDDTFLDANGNEMDEESGSDDTQNDGSSDGSSDPGEVTTPDDTEAVVDNEDQCINQNDMAALQSEDPDFDDLLSSCMQTCFSSENNDDNCIGDCITDESNISAGCAQCYNSMMACYMGTCFSACSEENSEDTCDACLAENCFPAFFSCTGLNPDEFD
jgi:hypothetical protein